MLRTEAGFAMLATFVNQCGFKTMNNAETGLPFTSQELMPWAREPEAEISLEDAMRTWN